MTLENRMKIEGARGKNVRSSIFFNFLVKTLGGYFGAQKVDFDDSKSKNGYSPMDSSSFRGKNQNLSRSFHAYQIDAHKYVYGEIIYQVSGQSERRIKPGCEIWFGKIMNLLDLTKMLIL